MAKRSLTKILNKANERINKINPREYNKELRRLQRAVERIEKRGYTFGKLPFKELKQPKPASIERLQAIKTKDLYKYAKYETEAGTISGTERRKQERQESARKARETRLRKESNRLQEEADRVSRETLEQQIEYNQQQFEEEIRRRDEETKRRLKEEQEFRERFSQGKIIYEQVMDMINDIDIMHEASALSLRRELEAQFDAYGEDAVLMSMANAPSEFIETAKDALRYKPDSEQHLKAITRLRELITGTVLTMEEAQEIHDRMEQDSYYDGI